MRKKLILLVILTLSVSLFIFGCDGEDEVNPFVDKLETPTNVVYDGTKITWDPVTDADGYSVQIDDQKFDTETAYYEYSSNSTFMLAVKAVSTNKFKYNSSDWTKAIKVQKLSTPGKLAIFEGALVWEAVSGASYYEVYDNDHIIGKSNTASFKDFSAGNRTYTIHIVAKNDNGATIQSDRSAPITFRVLPSPANLAFDRDNNKIKWDSVDGVKGYTVKIEDEEGKVTEHNIGSGLTTYDVGSINKGTELKISVRADIISANTCSSAFSFPLSIVKLDSVNVSTITLSDDGENATKVTFEDILNAEKYLVSVNNSEVINVKDSNFTYKFGSNTSVLSIKAVAPLSAVEKEDGIYYFMDSEYVDYRISRLKVPTNIRLQDGAVVWDKGSEENSWEVAVDDNGNITSEQKFVCSIKDSGTHNIRVRAKGDGKATLSSFYSDALSVEKLEKPKDFRLNEDILSWSPVMNSQGYCVYVNDNEFNVTSNNFNIDNYKKLKDINIQVVAVGSDNDNILDSAHSDVFTVVRLDTPENVVLKTDGSITWNSVDNAVQYCIDLNGKKMYEGGTHYSLDKVIDSGETFVFTITARPQKDDQKYLASEPTKVYSGRRLVQPKIRLVDDHFEWDSINGAVGYEININGTIKKIENDTKFYPDLKDAKQDNKIIIKALANGLNSENTERDIDSTSDFMIFSSEKLAIPKNLTLSIGTNEESSFIDIKFNPVPGAKNYTIIVGGVRNTSDKNEYRYMMNGSGTYEVFVMANGDGCNTVDSLPSTPKSIEVLPKTNLDVEKVDVNNYLLSWNGIQNASGYRIFFYVYDKTTGEKVESECKKQEVPYQTTAIEFNPDTSKYKYFIRIQVIGDGEEYFDSELSNKKQIWEIN